MELIRESQGWKLYEDKPTFFTVETPEGFKMDLRCNKQSVQKRFEETIERGWVWIDFEFFVGSIFDSKIEIEKKKKSIRSDRFEKFKNDYSTTKEQENERLKPILKKAIDKFNECEQAFLKLQRELEFNVDFSMFGDTYGIYESYQYISFDIEGVYCKFKID